jgi:hypothetical protein
VVSYEHDAYAASIMTNVTATSSIPDETSHISYEIEAEPNMVFRGSGQTVFSYFAIPSIFESDRSGDPTKETGYHMSLDTSNQAGSQFSIKDLDKAQFLRFQLNLFQGGSALHTKRTLKLRTSALLMAIIGAVSGLLGGMAALMKKIEKTHISYQNY